MTWDLTLDLVTGAPKEQRLREILTRPDGLGAADPAKLEALVSEVAARKASPALRRALWEDRTRAVQLRGHGRERGLAWRRAAALKRLAGALEGAAEVMSYSVSGRRPWLREDVKLYRAVLRMTQLVQEARAVRPARHTTIPRRELETRLCALGATAREAKLLLDKMPPLPLNLPR